MSPKPAPGARPSREAKVAAARRAAQSRVRRARALRIAALAALAAAVVGVGAAVQSHRSDTAASGAGWPAGTTGPQHSVFTVAPPAATTPPGTATPTTAADGGTARPVPVDIYEDFQCPACRDFESTAGATIKELVAQGRITVRYHPIAFLDRASSTRYSTRALNAAACVIDRRPSAFTAFHELMFARQPAENSAGLDDATLVALAREAGADGLGDCVRERPFEGWTARVTDQSSKDGITGTPTVRVAGKTLTDTQRTPDGLRAAVQAAAQS